MKKSFAFCFLLMIFSSCFAKEKFINYAFGISTGIPVYDSSQIKQINKYFYNNGTRIILGTNARVEFNILENFSLFADSDLLFDFNFNSEEHFNMLDLSFSGGVKFFPGIGGLATGIGYTLGMRFNMYELTQTTKENLGEPISKNDWGNGFKIFVEYDFTHKTNRILPIVGINWKFMPRGNKYYDNIFTLYCMVKL